MSMATPGDEVPTPGPIAPIETDPATDDAQEPESAAETAAEPPGESGRPEDGWSLIAMVPHDGREPPATASDEAAQSVWCAVSAMWHPSLLARARELPRIESIDVSDVPGAAGDPDHRRAARPTRSRPDTGPRPRTPAPPCSMRAPTAPS